MLIILLYIFVFIVVLMRLFELKDAFIEIWNEDYSTCYKIFMSIFATAIKFVIIIFTCFFSNYFIDKFLM